MPLREVMPDPYVYVRYTDQDRRKWMEAIQLVKEPEEEAPFSPVLADARL